MIRSSCLCKNSLTDFKEYIEYKNETVFKTFEGIKIVQCLNCGLLKTIGKKINPRQSRFIMYEKNKKLFIDLFDPIVKEIIRYKTKGQILDVGCSSGIMLQLLRDKGFDVYGLEINKKAYQYTRKRLGKNIFYGSLYVFKNKTNKRFDVIIFNHVLEHIQNTHEQIKIAYQLLKKGGLLVVGVPNRRNVIFLFRKKFWEPLMPLEHIWHFSDNYMIKILIHHGFNIVGKQYDNDKRLNYPLIKRGYFFILSLINRLLFTGESVTLFAIKK